jgi:hypothetical protein
MRDATSQGQIYSLDLERLLPGPGVYVFARRWGRGFEALYVGKANNIRARIPQQLNNVRLMQHLRHARTGTRVVIAGEFRARGGQRAAASLPLIEKALIRHFLSEGHDLVNVQGTTLRQHEVISANRPLGFVPSPIFLERASVRRRF